MTSLKPYIFFASIIVFTLSSYAQNYNNIEFIENKGQWDKKVKFKGNVYAGAVFIRENGFTILKHHGEDYARFQEMSQTISGHSHMTSKTQSNTQARPGDKLVLRSHSYNVDFIGASPQMRVVADKEVPTFNNYFIGNDPSKWASGCKVYLGITLQNVYPNVDVRYYTHNGLLKYDIIAKPGADLRKIALKYDGVEKLEVKNKELVLKTSIGELRESYPYTYQFKDKGRDELVCRYIVTGNVVRFDVKNHDPSATVVIDPTLMFCSFAGSTADNWGFTATYGPDGSFYGGGIVFEGEGSWPVTPGAFQTVFQGGFADGSLSAYDIGIIKLSPNGGQRIYATYIGGAGNEQPHSLIVDGQGNLILAGRSNSNKFTNPEDNYPTTGPVIGPGGAYDVVVTKLNATGSALIGSRMIGGAADDGVNIKPQRTGTASLQQNYGDDGRSEVIIDGAGNIYVATSTQSQGFPTTANAFQRTPGGTSGQDAAVLKFNPDLSVNLFSSFLGGSGNDAAYVLALAPNGDIYVAGGTESQDFPGPKGGTIGPSFHTGGPNDNIDGYIAQISNNGNTLIRSTFIGTPQIDQIFGIQFDRNGFVYITGQTRGTWPIINAAYHNGASKQFISKLRPDLSGYVYSTTFGNGSTLPNISPTAFLVDRCENVYVSGWGSGTIEPPGNTYNNAGTIGMPITADALKNSTDGRDFYFFVLRKDATGQLYGSFFGQDQGFTDHVDGGTSRFDANGVIYQGVCANCTGRGVFPTTPGVWSGSNPAAPGCNLGMFKLAFNLAGVGSQLSSAIRGIPGDTAGCVPLDVTFTDLVRNAQQYYWNFGDGSPEVGPLAANVGYTQTHTYNAVGTYRVRLIAVDSASCNIADTAYMNIRVGDLKANLAFNMQKVGACTALDYQFNNLSTTLPIRPFTDSSFIWDFGDGSPQVKAGLNPVPHTFPAIGSYNVKLILNDSAYCNFPDVLDTIINVAANVEAGFETDPGCAPYTAEFRNTSIGGLTFEWNFGDPASGADNTSTLANPTHFYANPGTYTVTLTVTDPNTCNRTDTETFELVVSDKPTANFSFTPVVPVENTPNVFRNESSANAVSFKWLFGDGDSLVTTSRADVTHQYNATGTFDVCLIAYNSVGCPDSTCLPVSTIVTPALDVPNAFTPNSNDINSKVMVRGFGIAKMRFTIWNRWGQKVFETSNPDEGWDGKVKGVVQPMDVYAYTLEVEFFDGTKASRKGDITLIR